MISSTRVFKVHQTTSDGFIVIAVLWILGAMATLASIYTVYVIDNAAAFSLYDDRLHAEALSSAALELTAYQLIGSSTSRPSHGEFAFRLGSANVSVAFQSEAGRVDLNAAPKQVLQGLFVALGTSADDADQYATRIISWRTPQSNGQDSERLAYKAANLDYAPRGGPFSNVNELSLVLGLSSSVVDRTLPFLTVFSGRSQINALEAAPEVIAALPGMTPDRLADFLAQRQTSPDDTQTLIRLLGPAQAYATAEAGKTSRVTVRIKFDNGREASSEAVILLFEQGSEPYSVLSWQEPRDEPRGLDKRRPTWQ